MSCDRNMCLHNILNDIPCEECPCYEEPKSNEGAILLHDKPKSETIEASWDSADDDTTFCCCSNCGHCEKNNLKGTCPGCGAAMY